MAYVKRTERVGFELLLFIQTELNEQQNREHVDWLRSRVQIPQIHFYQSSKIRH